MPQPRWLLLRYGETVTGLDLPSVHRHAPERDLELGVPPAAERKRPLPLR